LGRREKGKERVPLFTREGGKGCGSSKAGGKKSSLWLNLPGLKKLRGEKKGALEKKKKSHLLGGLTPLKKNGRGETGLCVATAQVKKKKSRKVSNPTG